MLIAAEDGLRTVNKYILAFLVIGTGFLGCHSQTQKPAAVTTASATLPKEEQVPEARPEVVEQTKQTAENACSVVFGRKAFNLTWPPRGWYDDGPCVTEVAPIQKACTHEPGCCSSERGCCYKGRAGQGKVYMSVLCDPEWGSDSPAYLAVVNGRNAKAECLAVTRRQWKVELKNMDGDRDAELLFADNFDEVPGCFDFVDGTYKLAPQLCMKELRERLQVEKESQKHAADDERGQTGERFIESLETVIRNRGCSEAGAPEEQEDANLPQLLFSDKFANRLGQIRPGAFEARRGFECLRKQCFAFENVGMCQLLTRETVFD